jgi:hypothetical protein
VSEAADRLAFVTLKGQGGMRSDGISKFLEFSINALLPEGRFKGERIEEEVNIFGEPLNQALPLG